MERWQERGNAPGLPADMPVRDFTQEDSEASSPASNVSSPNHVFAEKNSEQGEDMDQDFDASVVNIDYDGDEEQAVEGEEIDVSHLRLRMASVPKRTDVQSSVNALRQQLQQRIAIDPNEFFSEFDDQIQGTGLVLGAVPVDDLETLQKAQDDALAAEAARIQALHARHLEELGEKEIDTLKRLDDESKERMRAKEERERRRDALHARRVRNLNKAFTRARRQLKSILYRRQNEVTHTYGVLRNAMLAYGTRAGQRSQIDWHKYRRGVELRVNLLRAVKDKLPNGDYILLASIYERLGGSLLPWRNINPLTAFRKRKKKSATSSLLATCPLHDTFVDSCECCQGLVGSTIPIYHDGQFSTVEMRFAQSLYTVAPSRRFMKPYMTVVFELVLLKDDNHRAYNQVVGWGAFPLNDATFDVVQGKYRVPLLRGGMDSKLSSYSKIEAHLTAGIDNWLANLYFEVIHMPRGTAGKKEFDHDRAFTARLLQLTERDRNNQQLGQENDSDVSSASEGDDDDDDSQSQASSSVSRMFTASTAVPGNSGSSSSASSHPDHTPSASSDILEVVHDVVPGMSFVHHGEEEAEVRTFFDPEAAGINTYTRKAKMRKQKETHAQKLEKYQFGIRRTEGFRAFRESTLKIQYMFRAMVADLGLTEWRTLEFWITWLMIVMLFWARIYTHYFGEWLFLKASGFPVYSFEPSWITMDLGYDATQANVGYSIGVIFCGYLFNCFLFMVLVFVSFVTQLIHGSFFSFGSQFILVFGLACFADEFFLLIVDSAIGNTTNGDAFLLYTYYESTQGTGILGACLTVLLFTALMIFSGFLVYNYVLRLHNNGLMHDVYVRLHAPNYAFFVPHDLEMSIAELRWIVEKAEAWRGYDGERRKTVVFDYVTKDEQDARFLERTTHLAIFTIDPVRKTRNIYRQFLRLPDGLLIEIFSSIEAMGSEEYSILQRALLRPQHDQAAGLEDFLEGRVATRGRDRHR
jgi:hypothetical protein